MSGKKIISLSGSNLGYEEFKLNTSVKVADNERVLNEKISLVVRNFKGYDRTFDIPISGRIVPVVRAIPERLFLGYIKTPIEITKELIIKHEKGENIQITASKCPKNVEITYKVKNISQSEKKLDISIKIQKISSFSLFRM